MTAENRFILDLTLRSAEEKLERDFRTKLRQSLDEAMNRAALKRMHRTPQCREQVVVDSNAGHFPSQSINNSNEEWTQSGSSSRGPRQGVAKLQGDTGGTIKKQNSGHDPSRSLEEGEIEQNPKSQETLQWEQFMELKSRMVSVANPGSREEQLYRLSKLEHQMAQAISYASSKVLEKQVENQIGTSLRGVKREADRILVEVEGSLLRCKAEAYTNLWKGLKDVLTRCQHVASLRGI